MLSLADNPDFQAMLSKNGKYHITLIYLVHDDQSCGGSYHARFLDLRAGVGGQTIQKMIEQAYDALEADMEGENYMQSDVDNVKHLVVFDLVECLNLQEHVAAYDMRRDGMHYQEMNKALLQ